MSNTIMLREADLDFWREFLELYRDMPALWKVNSDEYKNRKKKQECYERLTEKLKEIEPLAAIDLTKKKINTFRSNYRREVNKVLNSKIKGGPLYTPSVWYYKHLDFLYEGETAEASPESLDEYDESLDIKPFQIAVS